MILYVQLVVLDIAAIVIAAALTNFFLEAAGGFRMAVKPYLVLTALYLAEGLSTGCYSLDAISRRSDAA